MTKTDSRIPGDHLPYVSVIMPVYNEEAFIGRSLKAILCQSYPKELMEIVVADGMSTDGTRSLIDTMRAGSEIPVKVVDNPKKIAPTGLNCALTVAKGDVVVRVDGHCEIDREYVANCVALLQEKRADGVGGPIETVGETPVARVIALAMSSAFGVGGSSFRTVKDREMYTDTVAFPGYTRRIIEKVGPFNEELVRNQDDEYNFRIRKSGGKILLSPTIQSRYYSRGTFRSLWRQYFQYGFWKVRVMQLHMGQMSLRQFVPFAFVAAIFFLALLSLISPAARYGLVLLTATYLLVTILAAIMTCKKSVAQMPGVALSFAILHTSYGCGFFAGLVFFIRRWGKSENESRPRKVEMLG
jgi:glycosyltransferase involved in cell wall biosynthesis